ncbi:MAG: DUF4136 domain-containing protein [Planctomycetota bacterium]
MAGFLLALASVISCAAPSVRADVMAFANADAPLQGMNSFAYAPTEDETHALRNQQLFKTVQELLEQQGLVEAVNPKFFITLRTKSDPTTIETPSYYEMGPRISRGYYHTAYMRGTDGNRHPTQVYVPGSIDSYPYRVPSRSIPAFAHHLDLEMRGQNGEILWQGSIDLVETSRDLTKYMKLFLPQLLEEFPAPSGKSIERKASFVH